MSMTGKPDIAVESWLLGNLGGNAGNISSLFREEIFLFA